MTLEFLNPSRSFDEVRNAIRFIGHDGMFEVPFFVEVEALARSPAELRSTEVSEEMYLSTFDAPARPVQWRTRWAVAGLWSSLARIVKRTSCHA